MKKLVIVAGLVTILMMMFMGCQQKADTENSMEEQNEPAKSMEEQVESKEPMEAQISYVDVTPEQAKELMETRLDLVVLDVSPKFAEGHLPKAINIYIDELEKRIGELDKEKPFLVYCHVDSVSQRGAQILVDSGFAEVYRLKGNYAAWVEAGYEVEM